MKEKLIAFIPDFEESKKIVIARWKTMEEAIMFAKKICGFDWKKMEKLEDKENTWIWIMKK